MFFCIVPFLFEPEVLGPAFSRYTGNCGAEFQPGPHFSRPASGALEVRAWGRKYTENDEPMDWRQRGVIVPGEPLLYEGLGPVRAEATSTCQTCGARVPADLDFCPVCP